jgi:D-alanyl-D-alanine carboxypeptidase-like protein
MATRSYLNKTFSVRDPEARIRQPANLLKYIVYGPADTLPPGKKIGDPKIIPQGTQVRIINAKSINTKLTFVLTESTDGLVGTIGWTSADNLAGKFLNETIGRLTPTDDDRKGPNALWQSGRFLGQASLIEIVGSNNETERITADNVEPYLEMVSAAAKDGITICIRSGFRSFPEQVVLFSLFTSNPKKFALAAEPGRSNHQNGTAFDLDVGGFDGNPVYDWLKVHGPDFGFIRTVNREPWHWEFRPDDAANLASLGKFKLPGVTV